MLSLLVPGTGHLYAGAPRRGLMLLGSWAGLCAAAFLVATRASDSLLPGVGRPLLAAVLVANVGLLAFRLFAIVDAWRCGADKTHGLWALPLIAIVAVASAPHLAAGYLALRSYALLEEVFADEEPHDVLAARGLFLAVPFRPWVVGGRLPQGLDPPDQRPLRRRHERVEAKPLPVSEPLDGSQQVLIEAERRFEHPWVTILLLGSDHGPRQGGDRTDTMIVAALQRETGRAVALGVPRNLVQVPLGGVAARAVPRFSGPLNALYSFARARPELFPGGRNPGATALKQTISRLLGIRVDYFALVDLDGFVDVVDALGGVTIRVKERLVDEVTRPAWRETKPKIDVYPGRTYRFSGRTALAYVRSRKASNDYRRMARQRCFLSAMANQLDVVTVLRNFPSLAASVEESIRTDIPLNRVPDLVRLAAAVDPRRTLTETFGVPYIAGRRAADGYPIPNVAKIQATVREAIVHPVQARDRLEIAVVSQSC